jgi:hypothetical protein
MPVRRGMLLFFDLLVSFPNCDSLAPESGASIIDAVQHGASIPPARALKFPQDSPGFLGEISGALALSISSTPTF